MEIAKWSLKYQESAVENLFMRLDCEMEERSGNLCHGLDTYLRFSLGIGGVIKPQ
jgi:hypothetical protein